jgi:hypothetical protein
MVELLKKLDLLWEELYQKSLKYARGITPV